MHCHYAGKAVRRAQRGVINAKSIPRHLTPVMSNPHRSTQTFTVGIRRLHDVYTSNFSRQTYTIRI